MVSTWRDVADDGRDLHHLGDHMTKLRNVIKGDFF